MSADSLLDYISENLKWMAEKLGTSMIRLAEDYLRLKLNPDDEFLPEMNIIALWLRQDVEEIFRSGVDRIRRRLTKDGVESLTLQLGNFEGQAGTLVDLCMHRHCDALKELVKFILQQESRSIDEWRLDPQIASANRQEMFTYAFQETCKSFEKGLQLHHSMLLEELTTLVTAIIQEQIQTDLQAMHL